MNRETFELMINSQLYFLILILLAHMFHWFICFRLMLKVKNINPKYIRLVFFTFCASLYSILGKQVISDSFYIIGIIIIYVLFLLNYKIKLLDILWLFVGLYLLMAIDMFVIATPLMLIPGVKDFLFYQPLGNLVGTFIEIIFPLLLLISAFKINYVNFFSKMEYLKIEVIAVLSILIGILLLYHSSILFLFLLNKITFINIIYHIGFEWIISIFLISSFIFVKKEISNKEELLFQIRDIINKNLILQQELDSIRRQHE